MPGVKYGELYKTFMVNRSYVYQGGPDGKTYWFVFFKNDQKYTFPNIPRYSVADEKEFVGRFSNDLLHEDLSFGQVYNLRICSALVPLEEFVLEKCFYKRLILCGDAYHKVSCPSFTYTLPSR